MSLHTRPEDFIAVDLPEYDRESARVYQLCIFAVVVWVLLVPSFLSRPVVVDVINNEESNGRDETLLSSQRNESTRSYLTKNSKPKKSRKAATTDARPTNNAKNNTQHNMSTNAATAAAPERYIPFWVNLVALFGMCVSLMYIVLTMSPYNYYTPRRVFQAPLLTPEECQQVVAMATRAAQQNVKEFFETSIGSQDDSSTNKTHPLLEEPAGWQKTRHGNYPTTDLNLVTDPFTKEDWTWLTNILNRRLAPSLERFFGIPRAAIRMNDLFVVRYDAGKRAHLANHTDDADISFNVLLTEDFEGGGTRFWNRVTKQPFARVEPTKAGTFLTHGSQIHHEGYHVSKGTRMILVGFTNIDRFDPWTGQTTGLTLMASWFNMAWTHIRSKASYMLSLERVEMGSELKIFDRQWIRLFLRDLTLVLQEVCDVLSTHQVEVVVQEANATEYLKALDAEYDARGQYQPKANWFKGQNVDLEIDGTIAREWGTRIDNERRFSEL